MTTRKKWVLGRMVLKGRLSWLLLYLLPLFPIAYALRLLHVFTPDQLMVANFLCSVGTKLIFLGILSLESVINQIQNKRADQRRRMMLDQTVERKFKITPILHDKDHKGKIKASGGGGGGGGGGGASSMVRSSDGDLYTQSPRSGVPNERSGLIAGAKGAMVQSRSMTESSGQSSFQVHSTSHPISSIVSNITKTSLKQPCHDMSCHLSIQNHSFDPTAFFLVRNMMLILIALSVP